MPLIKLENLHSDCAWALWEINESAEDLIQQLNNDLEAERFSILKAGPRQKEKLASRLAIKKILEHWDKPYFGTGCDLKGKPILNRYNYQVSLSHSNGVAVAIISKSAKIGIDIEQIKDKILNISERVFSKEEIGIYGTDVERLITLWTIKEVLYKVYGEKGLNFKENLLILPFSFDKEGGTCNAQIRTEDQINAFIIRYFRYKEFMIAFTLKS